MLGFTRLLVREAKGELMPTVLRGVMAVLASAVTVLSASLAALSSSSARSVIAVISFACMF